MKIVKTIIMLLLAGTLLSSCHHHRPLHRHITAGIISGSDCLAEATGENEKAQA